MTYLGDPERRTQEHIIAHFTKNLGYTYLGNWIRRAGNRNIESGYLSDWLRKQGHIEVMITRALDKLTRAAALGQGKSLYDANRAVYSLLRYGVSVLPAAGEHHQTVRLVDWDHPERNDFGLAEEVTIHDTHTKRPDLVVYVNGIALGVIELKRSSVAVAEGIRQNLDNQKKDFIRSFFATVQLIMAANRTEGLRYGVIGTPEKFYLTWSEENAQIQDLDTHLTAVCSKPRLLEIIHDFIVFDAGEKKTSRHNQYFGVKAAQARIARLKAKPEPINEGGIIWHTQGSGKSLTMVWLAKWLREHQPDARVLIITDRAELDEQIEQVFLGVDEQIVRTQSGADLLAKLKAPAPWLLCSLIHKFGRGQDAATPQDINTYVEELLKNLPDDFQAKGNLFVFVDECHRTQSGKLHSAMKSLLPTALFIGFTGTPLLRADKQRSIEIFGPYIHTYKFDQAVRDGVVVDLSYEARDIDQSLTSPEKIDAWFEAKTQGLSDLAKAQLRKKWGTMQHVLSSQDRLQKIVADILFDMGTRDRLMSGRGNAMLVCASIYQACRIYEMFANTDLKGKCAIITSYKPNPADISGEETGEGMTERLRQYAIYRRMLADFFDEPEDAAMNRVEEFERRVKKKFVDEPGQMKLLIVVDKLLTGFDAPPATYLYIDKQMRDHGLFQAICRVNRLHDDDKEYGYIIDYKDLFNSLEEAIHDYTSGALDGYDREDVAGLLENRLDKARDRLEEAREAVKTLCEDVPPPQDTAAYLRYFAAADTGDKNALKANESKRVALYHAVAAYVRAFSSLANELSQAGYDDDEVTAMRAEVSHYEQMRQAVKLASGDYVDMKVFEPAMRHLLDAYIRAEESEQVSAFDDVGLVQLIVENGLGALDRLPQGIRTNPEAMAETIENNIRKLILDEQPINPKYYDNMSNLLDALIQQRKAQAVAYTDYLKKLEQLAHQVSKPAESTRYPSSMDTPAKQALYDNLDGDEQLVTEIDSAVRGTKRADWRGNKFKERQVLYAIHQELDEHTEGSALDDDRLNEIFEIVKNQREY